MCEKFGLLGNRGVNGSGGVPRPNACRPKDNGGETTTLLMNYSDIEESAPVPRYDVVRSD